MLSDWIRIKCAPHVPAREFRLKKTSVLFVCMGNICRSPTAEGVLRGKLQARGLAARFTVASAGTLANHTGEPPDTRAQAFAAKRGYDLSKQRARRVASADFTAFDHVLAMDLDNLANLQKQCPPEHRAKVGLLMRHARRHRVDEVPDPYYGGPAGFDLVLDYIEDACDGLIDSLITPGARGAAAS